MTDNKILKIIKGTVLELMTHPDNEPDTEFSYLIDGLILKYYDKIRITT